jgi:integrase
MPKKAKEMCAMDIKRLVKPGRHAVGYVAGLLIVVKESGAKSWMLRTVIGNRRCSIGLGPYPEISLADARIKAKEHREVIRQGEDPLEQKKARKLALIAAQNGRMTFAEAARMCHAKHSPEFRSKKHRADWINSVNRYAVPIIGNVPVDKIDLSHILKILEPVWHEKTETATRLRQRIESVLSWATVSGYRKGDNPARWAGNLAEVLPAPNKIKKVNHFRALPRQDMGSFMQDLRERNGMGARALEWIILTACRSGEARLATWDEIDFQKKTWIIPKDRMKAGKEHKVPLVDDALKLLDSLPRFEGSNFIFTAARGGPLSDMSISAVCKRMKVDAVPHGFRSTFRDWCAENTNFPREVAEQALAHTIENKVEAAYRRGDLFKKRRRLMESWAAYCNKVQDTGAAVVPINKAAGGQHG